MINSHLILVSGPSRSGKSRWSEQLISTMLEVTYIATGAVANDDKSWQLRLDEHKKRRPAHWKLIECTTNLPNIISELGQQENILLDSLGGFVLHRMNDDTNTWNDSQFKLISALESRNTKTIVVIEQVGWGVVPVTMSGNIFKDRLGQLSQLLELKASESWLVVQGRAINLKKISIEVP